MPGTGWLSCSLSCSMLPTKKMVMALPVNRNTKPETNGLPLLEAVQVAGVKQISLKAFNNHMAMFDHHSLWAAMIWEPINKLK